MPYQENPSHSGFLGHRRIATGPLHQVASAVRAALRRNPHDTALVFRDDTGDQVEIDLREDAKAAADNTEQDRSAAAASAAPASTRGRGRPKLGVVAREVTLLPEHWDWLASQPGGASVALRKLVHEARRASAGRDLTRRAQERAYKIMIALAGNLPDFEEASRALFAGKLERLEGHTQAWPSDVREYVIRLADPAFIPGLEPSRNSNPT